MSSRRNGQLEALLHEQEMEDKEMELREREVAAMEKIADSFSGMQEDIKKIRNDTASTWAHSQHILQSLTRLAVNLNRIYGIDPYGAPTNRGKITGGGNQGAGGGY